MKKKIYMFSYFAFIVLFSGSCTPVQILPGVGLENYLLLGTQEDEIFTTAESRAIFAEDGLFFTFEKGLLTSIMITTSKYSTKEGIRVGDNINKIKNPSDAIVNDKLQLEKGSSVIPTDNNVVVFSGILYIIKDNVINSILVIKE
jgi:hypothetical protein